MTERRMVIVGGGLAAATAARTLRDSGFSGPVLLVGEESQAPYDRPPLSKQFLLEGGTDAPFVHEPSWYVDHHVQLEVGVRAETLSAADHVVSLSDGQQVTFDKLLLATGSRPRVLDVPGASARGIHYLRTFDDAVSLRAQLGSGGRRVVIVGGGWIGLEAAAAARTLDNDVTVLEPAPVPLTRVLGPRIGNVFLELHRDHGVRFRRTTVEEFLVADRSVIGVRTSDGAVLAADVVVVGIGVAPAVELAEQAGLSVDNGVLTDAGMRTSHPDVFAAGDIANGFNPVLARRLRVEHWENARTSATVAAASMAGRRAVHDPVPYFFSDQYDMGMEYSGYSELGSYDEVVIRGETTSRTFVAFWLADSRVQAALNMNVWDVTGDLQELVRSRRRVDRTQLADPDVPLEKLASAEFRGAA